MALTLDAARAAATLFVLLCGLGPGADAMLQDNEVDSEYKVSSLEAALSGDLADGDQFGRSIALLGDLDGDQVDDIAVGAPNLPILGTSAGSVWILFMNANGTVKSRQEIGDGVGGFTGSIDVGDQFGISLAPLGDLDGDTIPDLAVGAAFDEGAGFLARGAVWILFMNANGTVDSHVKISDTVGMTGGFTGVLDDNDTFGYSLAALGEIDLLSSDFALAVGAPGDDDGVGVSNGGAVWVLFLDATGNVVSAKTQKISASSGGFGGTLATNDSFGVALAGMGNLDGGGAAAAGLAVGAPGIHMFPFESRPGTLWVLLLDAAGAVLSEESVTDGTQTDSFSPETFTLDSGDQFGSSMTSVTDAGGNHVKELAVGAIFDDEAGGPGRGAIYLFCFKSNGKMRSFEKITEGVGGFTGTLDNDDFFGGALSSLGDLDGSGGPDLAVGAFFDDDGGTDRGAVYTLFMGEFPTPPAPLVYGCNPVGTMSVTGTSGFGDKLSFTMDNPFGSMDCAIVFPYLSPFQLKDCGLLCPDLGCGVNLGSGFDITGTGGDGYLSTGFVIGSSIVTNVRLLVGLPEWTPGNPVGFDIDIPYDCSLLGGLIHVQALFWESPPFPTSDNPLFGCPPGQIPKQSFGFTQAVQFQIGP